MINLDEALEIIEKNSKFYKTEIIPIESAVNRIIAQDIYVKYDLPNFDNSAMDGFAILEDYQEICKVKEILLAGDNKNIEINNSEVIRIMTGAKVPKNIFAVIPIEDIEELEDKRIKLPKNIRKNLKIEISQFENGSLVGAKLLEKFNSRI